MPYTKVSDRQNVDVRPRQLPYMVVSKPCSFCFQNNGYKIPVPLISSVAGLTETISIFKINGLCTKCRAFFPIKFTHPSQQTIEDGSFSTLLSCDEFHEHINSLSLKLKVSFQSKKDETVTSVKTKRRKIVEIFPLFTEDSHTPVQVRRDTVKALDKINKKKFPVVDPFLVTKESGQRYAKDLDYLKEFDVGLSKDYTLCYRFFNLDKWKHFQLRLPELKVNKEIEKAVSLRRAPYDFSKPLTIKKIICSSVELPNFNYVGKNEEFILFTDSTKFYFYKLEDGIIQNAFSFNPQITPLLKGLLSYNKLTFYFYNQLENKENNKENSLIMKICNLPLTEKTTENPNECYTNFEYFGESPHKIWVLTNEVVLLHKINNSYNLKVYKITEQGNVFERVNLENLNLFLNNEKEEKEEIEVTEGSLFYKTTENNKEIIKGHFFGENFDFVDNIEVSKNEEIYKLNKNSLVLKNKEYEEITVFKFVEGKKCELVYKGFPNVDLKVWYYDDRNGIFIGFNNDILQVYRIGEEGSKFLNETKLTGELDDYVDGGEIGRLNTTDCKYTVVNKVSKKWVVVNISIIFWKL